MARIALTEKDISPKPARRTKKSIAAEAATVTVAELVGPLATIIVPDDIVPDGTLSTAEVQTLPTGELAEMIAAMPVKPEEYVTTALPAIPVRVRTDSELVRAARESLNCNRYDDPDIIDFEGERCRISALLTFLKHMRYDVRNRTETTAGTAAFAAIVEKYDLHGKSVQVYNEFIWLLMKHGIAV